MILFYFFILVLSLYGVKIYHGGFNKDYLSINQANAIKGISILMVFVSHSLQYVTSSGYEFTGIGDNLLLLIRRWSGQLVVVMFLFYSGFGVGEALKRKGIKYVDSMPRHRILSTIINFDIAVIAFIVLDIVLCVSLSLRNVLLSFIGWESVGNSNWYIFCIVLCYLVSYLVFKHINQRYIPIFIAFSVVSASFLLSLVKPSRWYNTLWVYATGFLYSFYLEEIEYIFKKYWKHTLFLFGVLFVMMFNILHGYRGITYNLLCIFFSLFVVVLSMKVFIGNKYLYWLGANLFPFYIYQRLPMLLISKTYPQILIDSPIVFMVISLVFSLLITYFYRYWRILLD